MTPGMKVPWINITDRTLAPAKQPDSFFTRSSFARALFRVQPILLAATLAALLTTGSFAFAGTRSGPPASSTQASNYQEWLTNQVRHELVTLPWLSVFDNLSYAVNGSEVTLYGQVVIPTTKIDANSAVKHIEGVTKVNDNIEVLPLSPFDNGIRRAEYRAIFREPALQRYSLGTLPPIHIIVENSHVTFEGVVDSQGDKDLAGLRANGVPNVFSVTNNLKVEPSR
jgi:hyperosmotically inducible protein